MSKKWIVQDPAAFAPTDAVFAGAMDEHRMWRAKKGTTAFEFAIPFESKDEQPHCVTLVSPSGPLPSSFWNSKVGGIRYILAGVVETKVGTTVRLPLAFYREIQVRS